MLAVAPSFPKVLSSICLPVKKAQKSHFRMNRSFLLAPALAAAIFANAQQTVHQVMVLNEGRYDSAAGQQAVPATLGSYHPVMGA